MARTIIDLSIYLENDVVSDPEIYRPKITYIDHKMSLPQLSVFFPGLKPEDMPDGEAWAIEKIELITHNGTHLDAPYHFASTMNHGERAITIDEVPLDWCFQPGVKLDFRHFPDGYVVTAGDVEKELGRIGHEPAEGDLVAREKAAQVTAGGVPALTDERHARRGCRGGDALQPADALACERRDLERDLLRYGRDGVVLLHVDAHHA